MMELEMCGVVFALESAYMYMIDVPLFTYITDHKSLEGLDMKNFDDVDNARLLRLMKHIAHLNFKINYLSKDHNKATNALSRLPNKEAEFPDIPANVALKYNIKQVQTRSCIRLAMDLMEMAYTETKDPEYNKMIEAMEEGKEPEVLDDQTRADSGEHF